MEFANNDLKIYLENLDIKFIYSSLYHPQNNGYCEALQKKIKKFLWDELNKHKEDFDIDVSIEKAIEIHNNMILNLTGFQPAFLRNTTDITIIVIIKLIFYNILL